MENKDEKIVTDAEKQIEIYKAILKIPVKDWSIRETYPKYFTKLGDFNVAICGGHSGYGFWVEVDDLHLSLKDFISENPEFSLHKVQQKIEDYHKHIKAQEDANKLHAVYEFIQKN